MKRQLPQWMLGVSSTSKVGTGGSSHSNSGKDIDNGRTGREKKGSNDKSGRKPRTAEKAIECEKEDVSIELMDLVTEKEPASMLKKCRKTKRTRKNVHLDDEMIKRKRKRTKTKDHVRIESGEDVASADCLDTEDNEDLTLEDLMTIAKEYVQEDNNSHHVGLSSGKHTYVDQSHDTAELGGPRGVPQANSRLSEATERNSCSSSRIDPESSVENMELSVSGNPTQDMLDVFLGPLLKKTHEEKKKVESRIENFDFDLEAYKQKNVVVEEVPLPTTLGKKKSSLKEKVMMFFD